MTGLFKTARGIAGRLKRRMVIQISKPFVLRRFQRSCASPPVKGEAEAVLIFTPEAGVQPHLAAMCVLGRTLQESGQRVLFARCFELFARCPVMDLYQLPYEMKTIDKMNVCLRCANASLEMFTRYRLKSLDLQAFLTPALATQIDSVLKTLPKDLREFEFESIPFGKLCALDVVLATKVSNFEEIGPALRSAWVKYIESSLLSYLLMDALCTNVPIARVLHFNDYSLMLGARLAARKHNIPTFSVTLATHTHIDHRRFLVLSEVGVAVSRSQLQAWEQWRDLPLASERVREVADDILVRLGAKGVHVFSPPKTFEVSKVYSRLNLTQGKKLLVAYTSSLDEMVATKLTSEALKIPIPSQRQPFETQVEWLQSLTQFVEGRSDLQLVVRVHPREGVNKRDSAISQHLIQLKTHFDRPFQNCRFVWPEDLMSSYDLGEAADLALVSWSAIGLELARLGVPVLACTNGIGIFPHDDFLEWGETAEKYFQKLETLLTHRPTLTTVAHAFRWYNLLHLGTSLDFRDVIPTVDYDGLPDFKLPVEADTLIQLLSNRESVLDLNFGRLKAAQHADGPLEEARALVMQLRRVLHFLYTGQDSQADFDLTVFALDERNPRLRNNLAKQSQRPDSRFVILEGQQTQYCWEGKTYSRFSPMCTRLAEICGDLANSLVVNGGIDHQSYMTEESSKRQEVPKGCQPAMPVPSLGSDRS